MGEMRADGVGPPGVVAARRFAFAGGDLAGWPPTREVSELRKRFG